MKVWYFWIFFSYKTPCKNICQLIEKCNQCNEEWGMGFLLENFTTWSSSLVLNMVGGWVGYIDMTWDKPNLLIISKFNSLTMLQLFEFVFSNVLCGLFCEIMNASLVNLHCTKFSLVQLFGLNMWVHIHVQFFMCNVH